MNCVYCHNSGIRYVASGPDDCEAEYCECEEGQRAEGAAIMSVLPQTV